MKEMNEGGAVSGLVILGGSALFTKCSCNQ
jgi:hypothetical protein